VEIKAPCKIGDTIGYIQKYLRDDNPYALIEAKVTSIRLTKEGLKVYAPKKFRPLFAEDIEFNTKIMSGDSLILVKEPFVLNDITRSRVERWVAAVNENPELARELLE
jgi:hypothetical protein